MRKFAATWSKLLIAWPSAVLIVWMGCCLRLEAQTTVKADLSQLGMENARIAAHNDQPQHCQGFWWESNVYWDSIYHEYYTYSTAGRLIQIERYENQFTNIRPVSRQFFTYDFLGRLIDKTVQAWDSTNVWKNSSLTVWQYDAMGNDTLSWSYAWLWFPTGYRWEGQAGNRNIYTYGTGNQIAVRESAYWGVGMPPGQWNNVVKEAYFFDSLGRWDSLVTSSPSGSNWVESQRLVQVTWADYPLRQRSFYKAQYYSQGAWQDASRVTCTFAGLDSECLIESYATGFWNIAYKEMRYYDGKEHLILLESQIPDDTTWQISAGEKHLYIYDSDSNATEVIDQIWDPNLEYVNRERRVYDAFLTGMAAPTVTALTVTAYPNPVAEQLHLLLPKPAAAKVRITDMAGRVRMVANVPAHSTEVTIPIATQLENGTYCYEIQTRDGAANGKFVLLR